MPSAAECKTVSHNANIVGLSYHNTYFANLVPGKKSKEELKKLENSTVSKASAESTQTVLRSVSPRPKALGYQRNCVSGSIYQELDPFQSFSLGTMSSHVKSVPDRITLPQYNLPEHWMPMVSLTSAEICTRDNSIFFLGDSLFREGYAVMYGHNS